MRDHFVLVLRHYCNGECQDRTLLHKFPGLADVQRNAQFPPFKCRRHCLICFVVWDDVYAFNYN